MGVGDEVVDHGVEDPGQVEAGGEHHDAVGPRRVEEGGIKVRDALSPLFGDVLVGDVGEAALQHHPLSLVHVSLPEGSISKRLGKKKLL